MCGDLSVIVLENQSWSLMTNNKRNNNGSVQQVPSKTVSRVDLRQTEIILDPANIFQSSDASPPLDT
jgi:hypothetical protein